MQNNVFRSPNMAGVLAIGLGLLFNACGGDTPPTPPTDTTPPTVTITDNVSAVTATGPVTFTFTFNEPITTGFNSAAAVVTGGIKGAFTRVSPLVSTLVSSSSPCPSFHFVLPSSSPKERKYGPGPQLR